MGLSTFIKQNIYTDYFSRVYQLLSEKRKRQGLKILLMTFLSSLTEVIGLALIIPVIYLVNDSSPIYNNVLLHKIYLFSGIGDDRYFIFVLIILLVVIFILKNAISVFVYHRQNEFAYTVSLDLTNRQLMSHFSFSLMKFRDKNSNYIARDVARMPIDFALYILGPLLKMTGEIFVLSFIIIGLASFDIIIFILLSLTIFPVVLLINRLTRKRAKYQGDVKNYVEPLAYKGVFEAVYSITDIKLFNKQDYFRKVVLSKFRKLFDSYLWIHTYQRMPVRILETTIILSIMVIYGIVILVNDGTDERILMVLLLFATSAYRIMPSLNDILSSIIAMRSGSYVFGLIEPSPPTVQSTSSEALELQGDIIFENVSFTYPDAGQKALEDINLSLKKGGCIGLIGPSGSGKSTIGRLMLKLIETDEGNIYLNGSDIGDQQAWYHTCGYVQQSFHILDASLAENISFGDEISEIDHNRLERVIEQAHLTELVDLLEDGYNGKVGEFGNKLAEGFKQRIAIARALYKGVRLLVLDEATNALDQPLENEIMSVIDRLILDGLTVLVISHHYNTLKGCEKIYELEAGRIKAIHDYESLIQRAN